MLQIFWHASVLLSSLRLKTKQELQQTCKDFYTARSIVQVLHKSAICSLLMTIYGFSNYNPTPSKYIHHCRLFCPYHYFYSQIRAWKPVGVSPVMAEAHHSVWACSYCLLSELYLFYGHRGAFGLKNQPSLGDYQVSDDSHVNAHPRLSMPIPVPANWAGPNSRPWWIRFILTDAEWKLLKQIDLCQQIQRHNKLGGFVVWAAWDRTSFTGIRGYSCLALPVVQANPILGSGLFAETSPWQPRGLRTFWEEPLTSR